MNTLFTLLQAAPAEAPKGGGSMTLIFILLIILIFYFFMIRPQQKRQKQVEEFRKNLQKGDKVTTIGGIHGKIREIKDATFVIEIAHDVCIEVEKAAINVDESAAKSKATEKTENTENKLNAKQSFETQVAPLCILGLSGDSDRRMVHCDLFQGLSCDHGLQDQVLQLAGRQKERDSFG